jgi:hypothetical protein
VTSHDDRCYRYDCPVEEHVHHNRCVDRAGDRTCTKQEHNHAESNCPRIKTCSHPD